MREKYHYLNEVSRKFLSRGYLKPGQVAEERFEEIITNVCARIESGLPGVTAKFRHYLEQGYYTLSTPILMNGGNDRGLPISCFGSFVADDTHDILLKNAEIGMMSKVGGGTSAYFGNLRPEGAPVQDGAFTSFGPMHFIELFDKTVKTISQGAARRGAIASYMPVSHPDIMEFLKIGEIGHPIQEHFFGVTISNEWMESMLEGDKSKRKIMAKILERRFNKGMPYIFFEDNVNDAAPPWYKNQGKRIWASNLCSEIMESTAEDESFVCCLACMNLLYYEEWKDTDAVETLLYFLDAIMSEFIEKAAKIPLLSNAYNFAVRQRALGLGVVGYHTFLQSKMIPFESMDAKFYNNEIFKFLKERCDAATIHLAEVFGEPECMVGYGRRNSMTMCLPPTTSTATIFGGGVISQSIEPDGSNYMVDDSAKGKFTRINPYMVKLLKEKNKHNKEVMKSILISGGSVQHLDFLSEHEKSVFKTFGEISQMEIVTQAIQRQKYIDQGQSLNLMIPPGTKPSVVMKLIEHGYRGKLKTFYYQRSSNPVQELSKNLLSCKNCEG